MAFENMHQLWLVGFSVFSSRLTKVVPIRYSILSIQRPIVPLEDQNLAQSS